MKASFKVITPLGEFESEPRKVSEVELSELRKTLASGPMSFMTLTKKKDIAERDETLHFPKDIIDKSIVILVVEEE